MRSRFIPAVVLAALLLTCAAKATETEVLYLSGSGYGDTVDWEFFCTEGRGCGTWTTIPVPSQWELEGFGQYNYGHDKKKSDEQGRYRHRFRVPAAWRERTVDLVFEGVMTDAAVRLNGKPAGPRHQGAFYRFRHDVTSLVDFAGDNVLEVTVSKQSADDSVNRAERDADYWVFGGIFRPVYLEAAPRESIAHVAVDARHDGAFRLRARLRGITSPGRLEGQILSLAGEEVGEPFAVAFEAGQAEAELATRVESPLSWSAETPHLYQVRLEARRDGELLHRRSERFGFRTIELIPGQGLYVNGHRVLLKGVNRHAFWPASGRTLNRDLDRRDVELLKLMNMNAVRTAHYPPDKSFLEACDELGLYVLDELAGWHDAYDGPVGRRLIREMVERDVNHPSILFWNHGNEGGWNAALDRLFGELDLQRRPVLRPDAVAAGVDTKHYLTWEELNDRLADAEWPAYQRWLFGERPLVMPTELLHGLYDGGSGASLGDYWRVIRASRRALGAFLWAFTDEAVVRSDRGGALDTDGNHAPDGVLGPYRELSGNFYAVREVFAPVALVDEELGEGFDGTLEIENRYDMTDLAAVRFRWAWLALPRPADPEPALVELESGELAGPPAVPGQRGRLSVPLPSSEAAEALQLTAVDPSGRDVRTWVLPRRGRRRMAASLVDEGSGTVTAEEAGERLILRAAPPRDGSTRVTEAVFDRSTGRLLTLGGVAVEGPRLTPEAATPVAAFRHWADGSAHVVEVRYEAGFDFVRWTLHPSGWLRLAYQYRLRGRRDFFGVALPFPGQQIENFEWLGRGPARVWKNRREGGVLGVWRKERATSTAAEWGHEPKLAGYYAGVYWARLYLSPSIPQGTVTSAALLTLVLADDLDLGIPTPSFPEDSRDAVAAVPPGGVTILNGISPIGTKFHPADELGPQGQPHQVDGLYRGTVWLYGGSHDAVTPPPPPPSRTPRGP